MNRYWFLSLITGIISLISQTGSSQPLNYSPGPANLDTSRFAHIYFLRDTIDDYPNHWLGFLMNDDRGMCVKVKMNSIYRVNTLRTGTTSFASYLNGVRTEIKLDLHPGDNHYVELKPILKPGDSVVTQLRVLDNTSGAARVQASGKKIQDRYCIIPFGQEYYEYLENRWVDTIRWIAGKKHYYLFQPLPSWETVFRSRYLTSLGFHNALISKTYSEAGGVLYESLTKCKSDEDFGLFCKDRFVPSLLVKNRDSLITVDVKPIAPAPGISYSRLVTIDIKTTQSTPSGGRPLRLRATYVVFFWMDAKGKGTSACLYESERGDLEELHRLSELEDRIQWSWNSLRLQEIPKAEATNL